MIKQGDVAFIKTTGEAVYVLEFHDPAPKFGDKDLAVSVRRPVAGQDGVRHVIDEFQFGELESLDEQRKRFMSEREEVLKKYGPIAGEQEASANNRFGDN
jgi:hypothetical protein